MSEKEPSAFVTFGPDQVASGAVGPLDCSVTVGDGLVVYGTLEAVSRVQDYILLDSTHPVEKEDVRRSLARQLQAAEAKIQRMRALIAALVRDVE